MMRRFAAAASVVTTAAVCSTSLTSSGLTSTSAALAVPQTTAAFRTVVAAGGHWGKAEEVPGTAAHDQGGPGWLNSISCASAGSCSGGGLYASSVGNAQAYVVDEKKGVWGKAAKVAGFPALDQGRGAEVGGVLCVSAGNCAAVGTYQADSDQTQVFVVSERNGTWGTAEAIPGLATLNGGGDAEGGVSCGSVGNCSVAGSYLDSSFRYQAFVATQTDGTWGKAEEVPGTAALNRGGDAGAGPMSCTSAGNCIVVGSYTDILGNGHEFVVSETNGTWGKAERFPGLASLNSDGGPAISDISCISAGNCSAGGSYRARNQNKGQEVFVTTETNGTWGKAEEVPGTAALNSDGLAYLASVSCVSAGNCSAGGFYAAGVCGGGCMGYEYPLWPFVVTETNGTWNTAEELPGIGALNKGRRAELTSMSCAAARDCSVGGFYADGSSKYCCAQTFVDTKTNGTWGPAEEIPGTAALNHGDTDVSSVSCGAPGNCSAVGFYTDRSGLNKPFVVREFHSQAK